MINVLSVFGTRPEAIKMAPVIKELERHPAVVRSRVCVTAQHREMLDQVLALFAIQPDYDLDVMRAGQSPARVAAAVLQGLEPILARERPDWLLVQGDTTTVMAAALAGFYAHLRVGHVEAGLRTHDKWQPFPEEINRRVAGLTADQHFAPTTWARDNLLCEGVPPETIHVTGNPVIDALRQIAARPETAASAAWLNDLNLKGEACLLLVTAHRRENFGQPLEEICLALRDLAHGYGDRVRVLYPVHLNPNVQEPVRRLLGGVPNITLTEPLDYFSLVQVLKRAYLVLTDSGGLQEEAPGLGVPVLVLREVTERPEGVEAGTVRLVGANCQRIVAEVTRLLDSAEEYERMACAVNPYGDGHAAERIVAALMEYSA
ncbi:MAG: non-hydrolyzing UDP-N-acetylglucosamine 2-epimerase [Anaerolineales bacterium]